MIEESPFSVISLKIQSSGNEIGQILAEGSAEQLSISKKTMLTIREQPVHFQGSYMTLCPIALMATCNKCPAVSICPLKEVLGDHKPENPASAANDPSVKDKTSN